MQEAEEIILARWAVKRIHPALKRFLLLRMEEDDLVSEALVALATAMQYHDPARGKLSTLFALRAAQHFAKLGQFWGYEKRSAIPESLGDRQIAVMDAESMYSQDQIAALHDALAALPERERWAVRLRFFSHRSFEDEAARVGHRAESAWSWSRTGILRLRKLLSA